MNALAPLTMDRETFLVWAQGHEGRAEFVDGKAIMMTPVTLGHALLVNRLVEMLRARLDRTVWTALTEGVGVDLGPRLRWPDVVVEPVRRSFRARFTESPVLFAEVLSPSSTRADLLDKPAEYNTVTSLHDYLVLSPDEPLVWRFARGADGGFPVKPDEISGRGAVIDLPALCLSLPLAELYDWLPD